MAFNPFSWFRKHQKVVFAGLIILCMFVFILQFGQGDVFTRLLAWMGSSRGRGAPVATVYGKQVAEPDLHELLDRRRAANAFLVTALGQSMFNACGELGRGAKAEANPFAPGKAETISGLRAKAASLQRPLTVLEQLRSERGRATLTERDVQQARMFLGFLAPQYLREIVDAAGRFEPTSRDKAEREEERRSYLALAERLCTVASFLKYAYGMQSKPGELYLGGDGSAESLLDFMVWQQQADKLGITLTDADVMREINRLAGGHAVFNREKPQFETEAVVSNFVAAYPSKIQAPELLKALREEMRVSMAKALVLGPDSPAEGWRAKLRGGPNVSPGADSPYGFGRYYREMLTRRVVQVTPLPVEPFLKEVKEQPRAEELQALFAAYKDRVPDLNSPEPGFKEPRQVRVSYVVVSPSDSYFRERARAIVYGTKVTGGLADQFTEKVWATNVVQNLALAPLGAGPIERVMPAVAAACVEPIGEAHRKKQEEYKIEDAQPLLPALQIDVHQDHEGPKPVLDPAGVWEEGPLKDMVAQRLFAGATGNAFLAPIPLYYAGTIDNPLLPTPQTLKKVGLVAAAGKPEPVVQQLSAVLAPAVAQPRADSLFGVPALVLAHRQVLLNKSENARPKPSLPRDVMEPLYREELANRYEAWLLGEALREFAKKLEPYQRKAPPKGEIEKEAARLHLTYHTMPRAMTEAAIADELRLKADLGLGALREALEAGRAGPEKKKGPMKPKELTQQLGQLKAAFQPFKVSRGALVEWGPKEVADQQAVDEPRALVWLSQLQKERTPKSFGEVADKVREAWRLDRARALAKERADKLAAEINEEKRIPGDIEKFLAQKRAEDGRLGESFSLGGVSPLVRVGEPHAPREGAGATYVPFDLQGEPRERMPYPASDLPKQLQKLNQRGQAMVVSDAPAHTFYLAVLEEDISPIGVDEIRAAYEQGKLTGNGLYDQYARQKREEYARAVLKQLRKQAGLKLTPEGAIDIADEVKKRFPAVPRRDGE